MFQPNSASSSAFITAKGTSVRLSLAFEFGSNGKAQEDVKRDVDVIPAFIRQNLCEASVGPRFFIVRIMFIYQVGKWHFCCICLPCVDLC